jgi:deoxyribonuclease V
VVRDNESVQSELFAAVDVHYLPTTGSRAALVVAADPRFATITATLTETVSKAAPYLPGEFYRRELPALRAVLQGADTFALIVVDGYVDLDPHGRPGLGAHVHEEFGAPVVGVAKTAFRSATQAVQVRRGQSIRPLYVTSAGIQIADAVRLVKEMAGSFRIPDSLRLADRLARGLATSPDQQLAGSRAAAGEPSRGEAC